MIVPDRSTLYVSGIYMIFCHLTGHVYIGSAKNVSRRLSVHMRDLTTGRHGSKHLLRAYRKYGPDQFELRLLETCPLERLIPREQYYIDTYRAYDPQRGYNTHRVAQSPLGLKRTPEQRARMSAARQGKSNSPESNQKRREAWAHNHDEWQADIIEKRGMDYDFISPTGERVTGRGITKLAKQIGVAHSALSRLVSGRRRAVKGWKRANDKPPAVHKVRDPSGNCVSITKGTLQSFCAQHGLNAKSMDRMIHGGRSHHKGWTRTEGA